MAPTLHRTSENIRGSIRPCGSRPDFCKFFTSCFCTTAWCCHDAMRVPTTRRRQDAPSSSGRRVPTTPPSIVGRGVLTMPPRVVRTSWRRHDAPPPVPRRSTPTPVFRRVRAANHDVARCARFFRLYLKTSTFSRNDLSPRSGAMITEFGHQSQPESYGCSPPSGRFTVRAQTASSDAS